MSIGTGGHVAQPAPTSRTDPRRVAVGYYDDAGRATMDAEEIADLELHRDEDGVIRKPRWYLLINGVRR